MGNSCSNSLSTKPKEPSGKINTGEIANRKKRYQSDYLIRLLLIGDSNVGKSSILLRETENIFTESFLSTIGVDFKIMNMEIDSNVCKVQIWDTAGQERFRTITSSYYRGAQGIFLVYSVTSRESFRNVAKWLQEIERYAQDDVLKVLVGNKADQEDDRVVSLEEGRQLADTHGLVHFETSAKSGFNVNEMFLEMNTSVLKKLKTIY